MQTQEPRWQPITQSSRPMAAPALSKYVLQRGLVPRQNFIVNCMPLQLSNANMSEAQLISAFWECYTPSRSVAQAGSPCVWLQHSISVPNPPPALRLSLRALAMTRLGWLQKDDAVIHEGKVIYGYALRELQKALYDQRSVWQDETMATCNVLALYEVSTFSITLFAVLIRVMQLSESTSASIVGYNSHVVSYLFPPIIPLIMFFEAHLLDIKPSPPPPPTPTPHPGQRKASDSEFISGRFNKASHHARV